MSNIWLHELEKDFGSGEEVMYIENGSWGMANDSYVPNSIWDVTNITTHAPNVTLGITLAPNVTQLGNGTTCFDGTNGTTNGTTCFDMDLEFALNWQTPLSLPLSMAVVLIFVAIVACALQTTRRLRVELSGSSANRGIHMGIFDASSGSVYFDQPTTPAPTPACLLAIKLVCNIEEEYEETAVENEETIGNLCLSGTLSHGDCQASQNSDIAT